jgi:hypothetical protein
MDIIIEKLLTKKSFRNALKVMEPKNGKIEAASQTFETPLLCREVPLQNPKLPSLPPHLNISVLKVLTRGQLFSRF